MPEYTSSREHLLRDAGPDSVDLLHRLPLSQFLMPPVQ